MTEQEKKELKELIAKKKAKALTETEAARLDELNKKCGYKGNKGKGKGKDKNQSKDGFKPGNDFSWWSKIPELLKDAANYKCNYVAGNAIAGTDIPFVIPGVVTIKLKSVYGCNVTATDALNVWARDLYLRMFQKYRPVSGYSASDLGITLLAALEVVKLIAKYERIYGIINRYSVLNVNMPLVEAEALGLSVVEVNYLQSHLADFRFDLNFLIRKAQRLCIPKDMSAIADALSLFGYEYLDHENARGQIIMFDTDEVGVYDDTIVSTGGSIQFTRLNPGGTFEMFDFSKDNMCEALDTALQALIGSDSVQRIFADLVVWFGQESMLQFIPVPEDYVVVPSYSESILHKMHNLESFDAGFFDIVSWADPNLPSADFTLITNGNYWIYQVDDRLVTKCGVIVRGSGTNTPITVDSGTILANNFGTVYPATTNAHVLDTYRVDVNEETVTEGILLKNHSRVINDAQGYVTMLDSTCFYIVASIELHTNGSSSVAVTNVDTNAATAQGVAGRLAILDWAPLAYYVTVGAGAVVRPTEIYGDLDSVVAIYGNGLIKLQRATFLSGLQKRILPASGA